jgi:hypothetical protein
MKDNTRKRQQRQLVDREADAIDRIIQILDDLAAWGTWRSMRRVLLFVLLRRWERVGKAINLAELDA